MKNKLAHLFMTLVSTIKDYIGLFCAIAILAIFSLSIWKFGKSDWQDFGLNAFTEILGIGITVFIIDKLLKVQERKRLRPLQAAAFRDVQQFISGLTSSWLTIYKWSGKDKLPSPPKPPSTKDFLSIDYFNKIRTRLNLDSKASVFPKRTWWVYLPQIEKKYRVMAERILERHISTLDPLAYEHVHKILHGFLSQETGLTLLETGKGLGGGFTDKETWEKLPEDKKDLLGHYWLVLEQDIQELRKLYVWCESNRPTLSKP